MTFPDHKVYESICLDERKTMVAKSDGGKISAVGESGGTPDDR